MNSANQLVQAKRYATQALKNYIIVEAKYILSTNERLYDLTICKQSPHVFLMFLIRTRDVEAKDLKAKIQSEYCAPDIPYYKDSRKYLELKYKLRASELHMEFYLDLLHDLCRPGNNFLGVYSGSKCLVAAKVSLDSMLSLLRYMLMYSNFFIYPRVEDNLTPNSSECSLLMTMFNLCSTFFAAI